MDATGQRLFDDTVIRADRLERENKELNIALMRKSAEFSDADETLRRWKTELEIVASKKGHNLCWIWIPLLLMRTLGHTGEWPDPEKIDKAQFRNGCDDFIDCLFEKRILSLTPPK